MYKFNFPEITFATFFCSEWARKQKRVYVCLGVKGRGPIRKGNLFTWLRIDSFNENKGWIFDSIIDPGDLGFFCNHLNINIKNILPSEFMIDFIFVISIILTVFP